MGISLTLAELKEYFQIWHKNNFDNLHSEEIQGYISNYLRDTGILNQINTIIDLKNTIVKAIKILSKSIDGNTNLTDSSSINDAASEIINKNINFSNINLKKLSNLIDSITTQINSLSNDKADITYVNTQLNNIKDSLGITPKQIQTQEIPLSSNDTDKDLNNYKTPGLYRSKNAANTSSLSNVPSGAANSAFNLVVLAHYGEENNMGVRQLLLTNENTNTGNRIYMRNYLPSSGTPWSDWYELYGDHNLSPLQMKVEWSDGSSPTTYTLLQK